MVSASIPSYGEIAKAFVFSLVDPFINPDAQAFYQKAMTQVKTQGVSTLLLNGVKSAYRTVKQEPLNAFLLTAAVFTKYAGVETAMLSSSVSIARVYKTAESSIKMMVDRLSISQTAIYWSAVLVALSSLPAATALEWNSVADAKAHYSGGPCSDQAQKVMKPATQCVQKHGNLQDCRHLVPEADLYAFTRHPSANNDPGRVTIAKLHEGRTCILSSLSTNSSVTKTCFNGTDLDSRTVEEVPGLHLSRAHEGLEPGQSVLHIGIKSPEPCGHFQNVTAKTTLSHDAVCLLTSLKEGEPTSQICFEPSHPETITLKESPMQLQRTGEQPASLLVKNPKAAGLDVSPDLPCPNQKEGFSLWDAFGWWWNQKLPCKREDHTEL